MFTDFTAVSNPYKGYCIYVYIETLYGFDCGNEFCAVKYIYKAVYDPPPTKDMLFIALFSNIY